MNLLFNYTANSAAGSMRVYWKILAAILNYLDNMLHIFGMRILLLLLKSDLSSVDFDIVRFLWNYLTLLTWTLSITVDNILMLNWLVLSGLIVSEGLRKRSPFAECDNIFLQNFDSFWLSFYSVCFSVFCVYLPPVMANKDVYYYGVEGYKTKMLSCRRETAMQGALQCWPKVEDWNWETIFYGHYKSIFNHCDIIGLKIYRIRWKTTQNKGYYGGAVKT